MIDEMGHDVRFSDSSLYDFRCIKCGATDGRDNRLRQPCPKREEDHGDET